MKKLFFIIITTIFCLTSFAQTNRWHELGYGANILNANSYIVQTCTDKFGNVYAAGAFTDANNNNYVAKWDGTN